ncbi:MAG TPA: amidase, partial [Methylomirabilota bacterium]|nr:amidase [Methylomirabilota bacterium]
MDDLAYLGIAELAPRLARRELSPVELCRVLLDRCARLEPHLNAFITLAPDRILDEARAAERELAAGRLRGPLHGVPIAVKDLCWTRGERTTGGSKVLADFLPGEDASVVARLRAAGAIVFGKTNTPEFAYGPLNQYHYGPSRNPWDLGRFTGGSSMGAAAALAGGLVPGALGSDTGGSIRGPAHWSGVTGLKPTYGRVPLRGVIPLATSLDHVGPMTRSAHDAALLLGVIAGHDPDDPTSADQPVPDYRAELAAPVRGVRIGVPRGYFWEALPPDIAAAVTAALEELRRLGLVVADVEIAEWAAAAEASKVLIRCEAAAEYRKVLKERAGDLIAEVRERLEAGAA